MPLINACVLSAASVCLSFPDYIPHFNVFAYVCAAAREEVCDSGVHDIASQQLGTAACWKAILEKKRKKKRFKLLWQRVCKWLKCPWAKHCSGSRHSVLFLEQIQWPRWEPAPFQESAAARMWENGRNSVEHTDSFSFLIRKLNIKYAKTCVTEPRSRKVIVLSKREFQQKYENETLMLQWLG